MNRSAISWFLLAGSIHLLGPQSAWAQATVGQAVAVAPTTTGLGVPVELTYTNPIIHEYLADPCLVLDGDYYYLVATGPAKDGRFIPIYRSKNLAEWHFVRGAVIRGAETDWNYMHFWAPEVIKIKDTYYLYFTASPQDSPGNSGNRIGLATAKDIQGPYENVGVVIPDAAIDPHPFLDKDGTLYMYYTVEHGNADGLVAGQIYAERMLTPFKAAGKAVQIFARHPWQEGPWMQYHKGRYFLSYSCGNWKDDSYHLRYAVGDSPLGPFKESEDILMKSTEQVKGPGHHAMFLDRNGKDWIVYHGWDPAFTARYPRIDRIFFNGDVMTTDGPTTTPQRLDE